MGFWDTVKKAATSAKCIAGFHSGEYRRTEGKPECNMEMTCPDCNKHLTKVEHKFGNWEFLRKYQCDAIRKCVFCGEAEEAIKHQWVQMKNRCQVERRCERCHLRELVRVEHGRWRAGPAHPDGMQTFTCVDCGETEERKFDPHAR